MTIKATTTRDLRKNFKKFADDVSDYGDVVLVTRPEKKNVVLLSEKEYNSCLLYTSPSPRDGLLSRMPSSA